MENNNATVIFSHDSDVGRSEKRFYEDRLRVESIITKSGLQMTLAVISDGIGGENAGERAAQKLWMSFLIIVRIPQRQTYCTCLRRQSFKQIKKSLWNLNC